MNNLFQSQQCPVTSEEYIVPYGTSGWVGKDTHRDNTSAKTQPTRKAKPRCHSKESLQFGMKTHAFAPRPSFLPADTTKSNAATAKPPRGEDESLEHPYTACSHFSSNRNPFSLLEDGEGNQVLHLILGALQSQQRRDAHIVCRLQAPCSQEKRVVLKKANEGDPS